jgi:MarR family 2-MHQ and catechol resistance regulon transcriptional repressor
MPNVATTDPAALQDARRLSSVIEDLIRVVQFRDRDRACCYDVSVSQCYALEAVTTAGPLNVNDLAAHLYLDKSTASRVAAGLEAKGYLRRERNGEDGRVVRLAATAKGRALHVQIAEDMVRLYGEMIADFDPAVREALIELVSRLGASFAARVDVSGGNCCVVPGS